MDETYTDINLIPMLSSEPFAACSMAGKAGENVQEAAVQWTFHLEKQLPFYLVVRTKYSVSLPVAPNTDPNSCPLEVKPHPMKTIYTILTSFPVASSPGPSQILSCSRGKKSGEGLEWKWWTRLVQTG